MAMLCLQLRCDETFANYLHALASLCFGCVFFVVFSKFNAKSSIIIWEHIISSNCTTNKKPFRINTSLEIDARFKWRFELVFLAHRRMGEVVRGGNKMDAALASVCKSPWKCKLRTSRTYNPIEAYTNDRNCNQLENAILSLPSRRRRFQTIEMSKRSFEWIEMGFSVSFAVLMFARILNAESVVASMIRCGHICRNTLIMINIDEWQTLRPNAVRVCLVYVSHKINSDSVCEKRLYVMLSSYRMRWMKRAAHILSIHSLF